MESDLSEISSYVCAFVRLIISHHPLCTFSTRYTLTLKTAGLLTLTLFGGHHKSTWKRALFVLLLSSRIMSALNQINDLYREDELPANRTAMGIGKLSKGLLAFRTLALQNKVALGFLIADAL